MTASDRSVELASAAAVAAADKLASDLLILDVSDQLVITDCFVLASAPNDRQVRAIVDAVEEKLLGLGAKPVRREGEPDAVLTSGLSRAADTAALVGDEAGPGLVVDARLREISLGRWEGLTRAEAAAQFPEEYASWQAGVDARRGDGETYAEVGARAVACLTEALDSLGPGSLVAAVTHGGTARSAIGTLLALD